MLFHHKTISPRRLQCHSWQEPWGLEWNNRKHGLGKVSANWLHLLNHCVTYDLSITNTYFLLKSKYKIPWMHPRSRHWHLIGYIKTRKSDLQNFRLTKAMRGAECWTDHILLRSSVMFKIWLPAETLCVCDRSNFHNPHALHSQQAVWPST